VPDRWNSFGNLSHQFTVLSHPPVPFDRVSGPALIYVEDWNNQGTCSYGAGTLFNLVYINRSCARKWCLYESNLARRSGERLRHPNASFSGNDKQYRWSDAKRRSFARLRRPNCRSRCFLEDHQRVSAETRAGVDFNVQGSSGLSALVLPAPILRGGGSPDQRPKAAHGGRRRLGIDSWSAEIYSRPGKITFRYRNPGGCGFPSLFLPVLK